MPGSRLRRPGHEEEMGGDRPGWCGARRGFLLTMFVLCSKSEQKIGRWLFRRKRDREKTKITKRTQFLRANSHPPLTNWLLIRCRNRESSQMHASTAGEIGSRGLPVNGLQCRR